MRPDSRKSPDGTHSRSGYNGINGFWDPETNMPCHHPIWHRLFAINVNTGDLAWRPSSGGSPATHGGLVFIGAGEDSRFRAFDSKTGKQVWTVQIDAPAHLAPITFQGKDGTGGGFLGERTSRDAVMAFAVPERHELGECGRLLFSRTFRGFVTGVFLIAPALKGRREKAAQPEEKAQTLVPRICVSCHEMDTITAERRTQIGWQQSVEDMASRGAQGSDQEMAEVVAYLTKYYGKINVNTATVEQFRRF